MLWCYFDKQTEAFLNILWTYFSLENFEIRFSSRVTDDSCKENERFLKISQNPLLISIGAAT